MDLQKVDELQPATVPVVSIIIPSYNYGLFLSQAIKSLQAQDLQNWECIIVDDGSTDQTRAITKYLTEVDTRISYIHQHNQGQPVARNTGLNKAKGRYIQFLDADDILESKKLLLQSTYLDQHQADDIVYGSVLYFLNDNKERFLQNRWDADPTKEWMPKISGKGTVMVGEYIKQNIFELGSALFRKSSIDKLDGFNRDLQGVEDYDLCFRAAITGMQFKFLDQVNTNVLMRHHESFSKNIFRMRKQEIILRKALEPFLKENGFPYLIRENAVYTAARLRSTQNQLIDEIRKGDKQHFTRQNLKWILSSGNVTENLYFLPRLLKAFLFPEDRIKEKKVSIINAR